jgi:phosphomevalonate kinase
MFESFVGICGFFIAIGIVILLVKYISPYESIDKELEDIKDRLAKSSDALIKSNEEFIALTKLRIERNEQLNAITESLIKSTKSIIEISNAQSQTHKEN